MRHSKFIVLFILPLLFSCKSRDEKSKIYSLRDTVVKEHIERFDSSFYSDTTDINYKVLKAYLSNDTFFLKKLHSDIERERKLKQQWEINDSCIHQPQLQDLIVDEAYRFVYTAAFCDYKLNVTISKRGDSANIHFIILKDVWLNTDCKVFNEYDKKISSTNWEDFSQLMDKADFWGLKETNGVYGLDGSTLIVTGFSNGHRTLKRNPRTNYVNRWGYSTLSDPFHLVLKLSENKQGCLVVK